MRFALSRAVVRCQVRRLRTTAGSAPLPTAVVIVLVTVAPLALARVGRALGEELAAGVPFREISIALVAGPCLAAGAAGAVIAASFPMRAALGPQVAAGPFGTRSALAASLPLPATVAALVFLPSLLSLSLSIAASFPGGQLAGLALAAAIVSALPSGAVAFEGVQIALRGPHLRLLLVGACGVAWLLVGAVATVTPLGPLAPAALAITGTESAWPALVVSAVTTIAFGTAWIGLAAERRDQRGRPCGRRHLGVVWRRPIPAAVAGLVWRRADVRRGALAAALLGVAGAVATAGSRAAPPGPFLLATTTCLLGSLVAALAGWGMLVPGVWLWRSAPQDPLVVARITWLVGLVGVAAPVALVGTFVAAWSDIDAQAAGVVTVLTVAAAATATFAGTLVPWHGDGLADQVSSLSAFAAVAVATSLGVGVAAPRLAAAGVPDPATAMLLCALASGLAVLALARRLERDRR